MALLLQCLRESRMRSGDLDPFPKSANGYPTHTMAESKELRSSREMEASTLVSSKGSMHREGAPPNVRSSESSGNRA
jgi:hypothetical protein